jgi:predicted phosphodiesterase
MLFPEKRGLVRSQVVITKSDEAGELLLTEEFLAAASGVICPSCSGDHIVKKGISSSGKNQRYKCRDCHTPFQIPVSVVEDYYSGFGRGEEDVRSVVKYANAFKEIELDNPGNILVFSCVHLPFEKRGYLNFLQKMQDYHKCETVICLGDLIDSHSISKHDHSPDGMGAGHEIQAVQSRLKDWVRAFPNLYITIGNHDRLPYRQAYSNGLPNDIIKPLNEIYQMPSTWSWHERILADDVVYMHGTGKNGENSAKAWMMDNRKSTVIGHIHSSLGVNFSASNYDRLFSMNVGCGIDIKQYAFEYNKDFGKRPVLGCGVVTDSGQQPIVCPFYV